MAEDFLSKVLGNAVRGPRYCGLLHSALDGIPYTLRAVAKAPAPRQKAVAKEVRALEDLAGIIKNVGKLTITLANNPKRTVAGKQKEQAWHFNVDFKYGRALEIHS